MSYLTIWNEGKPDTYVRVIAEKHIDWYEAKKLAAPFGRLGGLRSDIAWDAYAKRRRLKPVISATIWADTP